MDAAIDHSLDAVSDDFSTLTFECIEIHGMTTTETSGNIIAQIQFVTDEQRGVANLKRKVNTSAQGNILPVKLYRKMFPTRVDGSGCPRPGTLKSSETVLNPYGGTTIPHFGVCTIDCSLRDQQYKARFFVTDTAGPALFGLPLIQGLNLFGTRDLQDISAVTDSSCKSDAKPPSNKETLLAEFPDCFIGISELKGTYHITLDPEVEPVINSPHRVLIALKDEIEAELVSMEHQVVIEKVQEGQPT